MSRSEKPTIAFLGAGNMATSLISGLCEQGYPMQSIIATRRDKRALSKLAERFSIQTTTHNIEATQRADIVVLCVKPTAMQPLCLEIQATLQQHPLVIMSIAAGIEQKTLTAWLGEPLPIVRCMPNTPSSIRCGVSALHANAYTTKPQRESIEYIARAVGDVFWIEEEAQLHAITALSGCGPAYFYTFMESFVSTVFSRQF